MEQLGDLADEIVPLFITLDPERDTLPILKDYISNFYPPILGLTGTLAETDVAAKTFRAFFRKEKSIDNDLKNYLISHTSAFYVIDPKYNIMTKQFKCGTIPDKIFACLTKIL